MALWNYITTLTYAITFCIAKSNDSAVDINDNFTTGLFKHGKIYCTSFPDKSTQNFVILMSKVANRENAASHVSELVAKSWIWG